MRIAITYVCTGKYDVFWDEFYVSAEKYFYPYALKEYFVFTDSKRLLEEKNERIHAFYQKKVGWPYDTLLRYNWFCTVQDLLGKFDFCYFCNANSKFLREVTAEIIPYPTEDKPLVFSIHIGYYEDTIGDTFTPERNEISTACIPYGTPCRAYSGGFWGGAAAAFILMCQEIRNNIAIDMRNGYVAVWHDQSHLERYAIDHAHQIIEKGLVASEEYANNDFTLLIFRNKNAYGGNDALRGLTIKQRVYKLAARVVKKMKKIMKVRI